MGIDADPFTVEAARHMLGEHHHTATPIPATKWRNIPALFEKLGSEHNSSLAIKFLILTAARSNSALGAQFAEIEGNTWTVPKDRMKGRVGKNRDFRIPLSDATLEVIEACRFENKTPYLFPNPFKGFLSSQAVRKRLMTLKEDGRAHGFRTSFRTWVQDHQAAPYDVAETALGHAVGNKIERAYARSDLLDQRRALMNKWAEFVTNPDSAVELPRG
jgi:integrase